MIEPTPYEPYEPGWEEIDVYHDTDETDVEEDEEERRRAEVEEDK